MSLIPVNDDDVDGVESDDDERLDDVPPLYLSSWGIIGITDNLQKATENRVCARRGIGDTGNLLINQSSPKGQTTIGEMGTDQGHGLGNGLGNGSERR